MDEFNFDDELHQKLHDRESRRKHDEVITPRQRAAGGIKQNLSTVIENLTSEKLIETSVNKVIENDAFDVEMMNEEVPGGVASQHMQQVDRHIIDWKTFVTVDNLFVYNGGDRPVNIVTDLKKSQVSGLLEPFFYLLQNMLFDRYQGLIAELPYKRKYRVDRNNKVFTVKSSLVRYLFFSALDELSDGEYLGLQLAKQWFALNTPMSDSPSFDYTVQSMTNGDDFDIYALLTVAAQVRKQKNKQTVISKNNSQMSRSDVSVLFEQVFTQLDRLSEQVDLQTIQTEVYQSHNGLSQTMLLLDRMGLLKGPIPKDVGDVIAMLEQNRDLLQQTINSFDQHVIDEKKRQDRLDRENHRSELNKKRFEG